MTYEFGYFVKQKDGTSVYKKIGVAATREEAMDLGIRAAKELGGDWRTFWAGYGRTNTLLCPKAVPVTVRIGE